MNNPFLSRTAPGIAGLQPYEPGKPIETLEREYGVKNAIKLASNENPLGPSPLALEALRAVLPQLARYPDGAAFSLKAALAAHLQVEPEQLVIGNGSNEILELVTRAFVTPADSVMFSEYAFAVYPIVTQAVGATACVVPACDYGHDLTAMAAALRPDTKLIFVANPNNPTGNYFSHDTLLQFLERLPDSVIVVLDEAYFEYVDAPDYPNGLSLLARFPNLLVTRTFSKAYGLAGLRVGYGVAHPQLAALLERVRQPFNVSMAAQAAAIAALGDDAHLQQSVAINRQGLAQLRDGVQALGLRALPSVANFIAIDMGQPAAPLYQGLLRQGVIVRPIASYGMPHFLRVSVGLPEENQRFLDALGSTI